MKKKKILLVGVGGVGGFVLEGLIRSGFQNLVIIDKDVVEESNLNRQIISNKNNIGQSKVMVANKRAKEINGNITLTSLELFLDKNSIDSLDTDYDYIVDACDTLETKLALIKFAQQHDIKIISSMGVGNRLDGSKIKITSLAKTAGDPLAKKLRKLVKENHLCNKIPVVCSDELPIKKGKVNSLITSPGIAGLLIVNYIINDIVKFN